MANRGRRKAVAKQIKLCEANIEELWEEWQAATEAFHASVPEDTPFGADAVRAPRAFQECLGCF